MPLSALIITFCAGLIAALILARAGMALGLRFGIADSPGGRRRHSVTTSRLGVLPLFGGFTIAALAAYFLAVPTSDVNEPRRLLGLLAGGLVMFVLGVLDDRFDLPSGAQFAGQGLAALLAIGGLIFVERFRNPLTNNELVLGGALTVALSLLWFVGMSNTVNWLDGVDGLAASVSLVAAALTLIHMLRAGQYSVALLPAGLIGVLLGFLAFNFQPARLFLGGGAQYLGFVLACIGIMAGAKIALLLLVMGLPIADVAWQVLDRVRRGRSPAAADRGHLHLRLADRGWSARRIVALYVAICLLLGGASLAPQPPLYKLVTLALLFGVVLAVLAVMSTRSLTGPARSADPVDHPLQ